MNIYDKKHAIIDSINSLTYPYDLLTQLYKMFSDSRFIFIVL